MPTRARRELAAMALDCFRAQTYPHRELVIIDDWDDPSFPHGIEGSDVQYYCARQVLKIGAKRNLACSRAQGEAICHWDSDDRSAPNRIADQVHRLFSSGKPVTGYHRMRFTDGERDWWYNGRHEQYAVGTSLMYLRSYWAEHPFTDVQQGEDVKFVFDAFHAGLITSADAGDLMLATCHRGNTCKREAGELWQEVMA